MTISMLWVVKIRLKSLLISIIAYVLLMNVAYAATSKLIFSDVDVKVGGKTSNNLNNGNTINEQAKPGDTVEFRVKVQNNFTSAENLKIEDITVKTTIEGIDDGSDLEEESKNFDLSPGSDKRTTIKFEVPLEVDESTFDVIINAEGEDKNGTRHESEMRLKLEVDKKSHSLKITKKTLSPDTVSCNRKNIQLGTTVLNIGTEDEDDVTFEVINSNLGINLKDDVGELRAEPNEPESRFSKTYGFSAANDAEPGSYPITIRATYDNGNKKAEDSVTLTVNECTTAAVTKAKQEPTKPAEESGEVQVITPSPSRTTTATETQTEVPPGTTVTTESILSSNTFIAGIIIVEVVAVVVGILLVATLFARRA